MKTAFQITGIHATEATTLIESATNNGSGIQQIVDQYPGYPCRVSLEDAQIGETVLLFPYKHHDVDSPYQSTGAIYIRLAGEEAQLQPNEIPKMLIHRLLSLRVYDQNAMMIDARTTPGTELERYIKQIFSNPRAEYIHVHNAGPGCYNCQVNRI